MCLGMNPDKLEGNQVCASSSNRNFKGRQGSPTGRTLLMSPAMVAAAAMAGEVTDVRELSTESAGVRDGADRSIAGRALPMRGNDIDTDRIMPGAVPASDHVRRAGAALFEDDRKSRAGPGTTVHPFDEPEYQGASILLVNRNFGCGSSREHAPQATAALGHPAVVGESFAEIFFGNSRDDRHAVRDGVADGRRGADGRSSSAIRRTTLQVDLTAGTCEAGGLTVPVSLPPNVRDAFMTGAWDTTGLLLDRYEEVNAMSAASSVRRGF